MRIHSSTQENCSKSTFYRQSTMNIRIERFGSDNKIVIRGLTTGVATNISALIVLAILVWLARPHQWSFSVLIILLALVIALQFWRVETCTLDKYSETVTIERENLRGRQVTERTLEEIVGVGIGFTHIREEIGIVLLKPGDWVEKMYKPPTMLCYYYAYLVDSSGEHLNLSGVISKRFTEVSNAAEEIRDFLEFEEPIITEW